MTETQVTAVIWWIYKKCVLWSLCFQFCISDRNPLTLTAVISVAITLCVGKPCALWFLLLQRWKRSNTKT